MNGHPRSRGGDRTRLTGRLAYLYRPERKKEQKEIIGRLFLPRRVFSLTTKQGSGIPARPQIFSTDLLWDRLTSHNPMLSHVSQGGAPLSSPWSRGSHGFLGADRWRCSFRHISTRSTRRVAFPFPPHSGTCSATVFPAASSSSVLRFDAASNAAATRACGSMSARSTHSRLLRRAQTCCSFSAAGAGIAFDGEGRIVLPEDFCAHAGISDNARLCRLGGPFRSGNRERSTSAPARCAKRARHAADVATRSARAGPTSGARMTRPPRARRPYPGPSRRESPRPPRATMRFTSTAPSALGGYSRALLEAARCRVVASTAIPRSRAPGEALAATSPARSH